MLKHGSHDSAQTKGRLYNTRDIFLFHDLDNFLLKLNMLFAKTDNIFQINFNFAITLKFSLKVCFLLLGEFLEVFSY